MNTPITKRPVTCTYSDEIEPPSSASEAAQSLDGCPKPSAGWLRNPAWIGMGSQCTLTPLAHNFTVQDGGVNTTHFCYTHEEIDNAYAQTAFLPLGSMSSRLATSILRRRRPLSRLR